MVLVATIVKPALSDCKMHPLPQNHYSPSKSSVGNMCKMNQNNTDPPKMEMREWVGEKEPR